MHDVRVVVDGRKRVNARFRQEGRRLLIRLGGRQRIAHDQTFQV